MTVIQRVEQLCGEHGIAISKLERILGFGNGSLVETDHNKPKNIRADRVLKIADYFGVTTDWLLKGYDLKYEHYTPAEKEIVRLFQTMNDECKRFFISNGRWLSGETQTESDADRGKKVSANKRMEEEA